MIVRWTSRALSGVAAIFAYIAEESEGAAQRVADRILAAGESLAHFPERGRPGRIVRTRELVVDSYVLIYRVHGGEIRILSVEHGRQRR